MKILDQRGAQVESLLKDRGCTLTPQRRAILRFLDGNLDHPTATDIFTAVTADFPMASRATVYNTLTLLEAVGAIHAIRESERETRYDPNTAHHHHQVCPACGRIEDVPDAEVRVLWRGQEAQARVRFEQVCGGCGEG